MNRYSLSSSSRDWLWGPVLAGVTATATVGALFVVSLGTTSAEAWNPDRPETSDVVAPGDGATFYSPCHITPYNWPTWDVGPVPLCGHSYGVTPTRNP
jgi:hypothetical protein